MIYIDEGLVSESDSIRYCSRYMVKIENGVNTGVVDDSQAQDHLEKQFSNELAI